MKLFLKYVNVNYQLNHNKTRPNLKYILFHKDNQHFSLITWTSIHVPSKKILLFKQVCNYIAFTFSSQKTLSESKDDMRAYLWVTDDVLNQIRFLNSDKNEELKKAQQIINRIFQRDLYKLVGEKRIKCIDGTVSPVC